MERDLVNEGFGIEDCYPDDEAYLKEKRRSKIEWWKRMAKRIGWPQTGGWFVIKDSEYDAGPDDMLLKHETGTEIPFRIDAGESPEYMVAFFSDVFPKATVLDGISNK